MLREKITAAKQEDQEVERYILKRIERREKRARKK